MIFPSLHNACKNMLLLLLCVALNGTAFAQSAQSAQDEVPAFDESVQAANALIVNQEFAVAEEFILAQMQREDIPENDFGVLYYLLALSLVGQEKFAEAEKILRNILVSTPDATHVRLSLGRVLFKQGNDDAAERQLDLVLADKEVPSYVHQQAHAYLGQIRTRNGWAFSGSFGVKRDSNKDNATSSTERRNSRWGRTCFAPGACFYAATTPKVHNYVGSWNVSAAHRRQMSARTQLETRVAAYGSIAQGDWDESMGVQLSAGPRFFFPRGVLALSAVSSQHFSPNPTARSFGVLMFYQHALPGGLRPFLTAQYLNQNHLQDDELDANFGYAQAGMHFGLDAVTSGSMSYTFTRNAAEISRNSYKRWMISANVQRDFSFGFTFGVGASFTRGWFDASAGATLDAERYTEREYNIFILKRDWDFFCSFVPVEEYAPKIISGSVCGFVPKLTFSHRDRRSNLIFDGRSYIDNITGLEFTKNF